MKFSRFTRRSFLTTVAGAMGFGSVLLLAPFSWKARGQSTLSWQPLPTSNEGPAPRLNHSMIYDAKGDRLIVFGGSGPGGFLNDVWTYAFESESWSRLPLDMPPAPRRTPASFYDSTNHRMVTYAGQGNTLYGDTWALNLDSPKWEKLATDISPAPRYGTLLAYGPDQKMAFSFAGFTSEQGRFDDLWAFSPETNRWQALQAQGTHPGKRCLHAGAYDTQNDRLFIFGGQRSGPLGDLWSFNPASRTWRQMPQEPAPRKFTSLTYAPETHQLWLFGGSGETVFGDVWTFDIETERWLEAMPANAVSQSRERHASVWVPGRGMVVFGGLGNTPLNDLWLLGQTS